MLEFKNKDLFIVSCASARETRRYCRKSPVQYTLYTRRLANIWIQARCTYILRVLLSLAPTPCRAASLLCKDFHRSALLSG